jgi:hypothetical protein
MDSQMSAERIHAYAVYCLDKPSSADHRKNHAAAHLAYIESIIDKILVAGPLDHVAFGWNRFTITSKRENMVYTLEESLFLRNG